MQSVESKDDTSFANENESFMTFLFDVRGVNIGRRNLLVYIMVCLLLKELIEEKGINKYVP